MLRHTRLPWVLATMAFLSVPVGFSAADDLIVPGLRVGPVSRASTENSLLQSLGPDAVKEEVNIGEGMTQPGLVIYKNDPRRRLDVVWNNESPAHPQSVFICPDMPAAPCRWHTSSGIGVGVTLKELESRNGKLFQMVVWGSDVGGNLVSFEGGKLERELRGLVLNLTPRINASGDYLPKLTAQELDAVRGEKTVPSNHPVLQKLNPYVVAMQMEFPRGVAPK
jgi:hypothetical protein